MLRKRSRSFIVATATATLVLGLVGAGVAHAAGTLTVSPAVGLADPALVMVQVGTFAPFAPAALTTMQVAECGNAYADGSALSAMPVVVPGVLDAKNCSVVHFTSPGDITTDPFTLNAVPVRQTALGTGNRSCISAPPAIAPCFIYISTSVNLPDFSTVPITFANPTPATADPAPTSITVSAIGSPIATGKVGHALVKVTAGNPLLRPEGHVQVLEGATPLGGATLDADGTANVALGTPALGSHVLTATFDGNGSFDPTSTTTSSTLGVISANNITIGDASLVEGNSADQRIVVFPVVLSKTSATPASVSFTVVPNGSNPATIGTIASGAQVIAASGVLNYRANKQTVKYVSVKVRGNTVNNGDQTFAVQLSNPPAGYEFRRSTGIGTIIDDDSPSSSTVSVSVGDASVPEGDTATAPALKLTLSLSQPTAVAVVVTIQVSNGTALRGTKITGDYGGAVRRNIKILPNKISKTVNIPVFPDLNDELDETVDVTILGVTGAVPGPKSTAVGTILSDE